MNLLRRLHYALRNQKALQYELGMLPSIPLGLPFKQSVFYESNPVTVIQTCLPLITKGELIDYQIDQHKHTISIQQINGLWAGKASAQSIYPNLLEFSQKLIPEYTGKNRIGFETDQDFKNNCQYIRKHRVQITTAKDGIFRIIHRSWDNKYFILNADGAHHLAAIYRQCIAQDRDFTFECYIERHSLNRDACNYIIERNYLFLVNGEYIPQLAKLLFQFGHIPYPAHCAYELGRYILCLRKNLPKTEMMYQAMINTLPPENYFDLSLWLINTLKQSN
jgi:hypothetical protein